MKDWKTTTTAVLTALFAFVAFSPEMFPHALVSLSKFAMVGGLSAFGVVAKDSPKE